MKDPSGFFREAFDLLLLKRFIVEAPIKMSEFHLFTALMYFGYTERRRNSFSKKLKLRAVSGKITNLVFGVIFESARSKNFSVWAWGPPVNFSLYGSILGWTRTTSKFLLFCSMECSKDHFTNMETIMGRAIAVPERILIFFVSSLLIHRLSRRNRSKFTTMIQSVPPLTPVYSYHWIQFVRTEKTLPKESQGWENSQLLCTCSNPSQTKGRDRYPFRFPRCFFIKWNDWNAKHIIVVLNIKANIPPDALELYIQYDVPMLKIKKQINACKNTFLEERLDLLMQYSIDSSGRSEIKTRGVMLPE